VRSLRHQIELKIQGFVQELYSRKVEVHEPPLAKEQTPSFRKHFECRYMPENITIRLDPPGIGQRLVQQCSQVHLLFCLSLFSSPPPLCFPLTKNINRGPILFKNHKIVLNAFI